MSHAFGKKAAGAVSRATHDNLGAAQRGFRAIQGGMDNYHKDLKKFVGKDSKSKALGKKTGDSKERKHEKKIAYMQQRNAEHHYGN